MSPPSTNTEWQPRVAITDLEDFCLQIGMSKEGRFFVRANLTPRQYFGRLLVHKQYADALRFQTHTLLKREAVWWACLCLRSVADPMGKPKQAEALKAVLRWVLDPNEPNRVAAGAAGKAASFNAPIGAIAMSVFWSGGSLVPPNQPVVAPEPLMTANTLSGSFIALAGEGSPELFKETLQSFLALGIGVAKGKYPWKRSEEESATGVRRR